ncbi:MAG: DUF4445 domain-containing protein [Candidatus Methanomethylophilaceae archaeon]|nr:DUF4445 domain-containing protein [Candidatus Methanomethylophilaceae archaeon]
MDFTVRFLPSGKEIIVEAGTSLSDAAKMAGVQIATPCGGTGRCGRCIVQIDGLTGDRVLACVTYVDRDMVVIVPDKDTSKVIAAVDYMESDIGEFSPISGGLGLAVDIGTTTVAADFIDMSTGECIASSSDVNGQKVLGDDVLARIQHAADGGTQELRELVLKTINDMIEECASGKDIESVYIAGNTTMEHLFADVDPTPIREEPYVPVIVSSDLAGKDSGLNVSDSARVITMPCISAYVGGDITSDIVYAGMDVSEGISLLIDVGTNGEVALGNKDMMMVCSSSAGPAFEGGNLKSGMMARPGAIDSIVIEDGVAKFTVIGGIEPKGICGSGIIDLIAQLYLNDIIDKRGNFSDSASIVDGRYIVHGDIGISEPEIKDVIMTKAAIFSATRSLVRNLGLEFSDLEKVYIAGGFGNFINMDSAITIGMFPDVGADKFVYLGNSSLAGARAALVSKSFRYRINEAFSKMTYLDLSSDPVFYDEYSSAQFIPHTDSALFPSVRF